jgi:GTP-binding protein
MDPHDILKSYRAINEELAHFDSALSQKPQVIVLNKMDQPETENVVILFRKAVRDTNADVWVVSALTGEGVAPLKEHLAKLLEKYRECNHM